jgi:N-acetylglucosaminyldiphosphoundecaprenol N-acetyl-beta-D-mannosaminyltransferase
MLRLLSTRVIPLILLALWQRLSGKQPVLDIAETPHDSSVTIQLRGFAVAGTLHQARALLQKAVSDYKNVILDCSELRYLDARFLGLLLMLRKQLSSRGLSLRLVGVRGWIARAFRLHGLEFLLADVSKFTQPTSESSVSNKRVVHD